MGATTNNHDRFQFIEGARGFAAIQVVLLHYCSAFFPIFAHVAGPVPPSLQRTLSATPLFFPIDGNIAVYVFFLMSGFVLAPSFIYSNAGLPQKVARRFIRLFVPISVAMLVACALIVVIPPNHYTVYKASGSAWVMEIFLNPMTIPSIVRDIVINSMLVGYKIGSVFTSIGLVPVADLSESLNPPMWTLHAEFWGSMLIIAVAQIYRVAPKPLFWTLFSVLFFFSIASHYNLFLIGFAAYIFRTPILSTKGKVASWIGIGVFISGVILDTSMTSQAYGRLLSLTPSVLGDKFPFWKIHAELAAVLLLAGISISPILRAVFSKRLPVWLGKVSFSVYLLHFPILFTAGFTIFSALSAHLPYWAATIVTALAGMALTLIAASWFERFIDRPSVKLSRRATSVQVARFGRQT
jgi:peptidoglycan/LPS O-acetylase OafA/YrhL